MNALSQDTFLSEDQSANLIEVFRNPIVSTLYRPPGNLIALILPSLSVDSHAFPPCAPYCEGRSQAGFCPCTLRRVYSLEEGLIIIARDYVNLIVNKTFYKHALSKISYPQHPSTMDIFPRIIDVRALDICGLCLYMFT